MTEIKLLNHHFVKFHMDFRFYKNDEILRFQKLNELILRLFEKLGSKIQLFGQNEHLLVILLFAYYGLHTLIYYGVIEIMPLLDGQGQKLIDDFAATIETFRVVNAIFGQIFIHFLHFWLKIYHLFVSFEFGHTSLFSRMLDLRYVK